MNNSFEPSEDRIQWLQSLSAQLEGVRTKAGALYHQGASGSQIASAISDETDKLILAVWNDSLSGLSSKEAEQVQKSFAILSVGGSGRAELAPYSDTDLLLLYDQNIYTLAKSMVDQFIPTTWDVGLKPGSSFSTIASTIETCRENVESASAVAEARLLWGAESLFERFQKAFYKKVIQRRRKAYINDCIAARAGEQEQLGSTTKHLQPNVKKSKGGLRDIHLMRWIAYAHYKTTHPDTLKKLGVLTKAEVHVLKTANDFLMRVRISLHLQAGRANDVLDADEQIRISKEFGYEDTETLRDVEQFMHDYFTTTSTLADLVDRFVSTHGIESWVIGVGRSFTTLRVDDDFVMSPDYITVPIRSRGILKGKLKHTLRLFRSSAHYHKLPTPELSQFIQDEVQLITEPPTAEEAQIFLEYLSIPGFLDESLRHMFRIEVLDKVIPQFSHIRCLLQFNNYHSYTVDEHTFRALRATEKMLDEDNTAGEAYGNVGDKALLHLAVLLHDIGKGYIEDHSKVGCRIAGEVADRLNLEEPRKEILQFLVLEHLTMSHVAFRRDTTDQKMLFDFAQKIGTSEKLRMLYLLTIADLKAVGPGVWTDWKGELLTDLYNNLMYILSGKNSTFRERERQEHLKTKVLEHFLGLSSVDISTRHKARWVLEQVERFPAHYWANTEVDQIAQDLLLIDKLKEEDIHVYGQNIEHNSTSEYRILAQSKHSSGLFHRAVGVLTAKDITILSAHINTTFDGYVIDTLVVQDPDYLDGVPEFRLEEISKSISEGIRHQDSLKPYFQQQMRFSSEEPAAQSNEPLRVQLDTQSSKEYTILSVFAHDHRGLLYTITRCLDDLKLSVIVAKIATNLDQVADVFYFVDDQDQKVTDSDRLREIHDYLVAEIRFFSKEGYLKYQA